MTGMKLLVNLFDQSTPAAFSFDPCKVELDYMWDIALLWFGDSTTVSKIYELNVLDYMYMNTWCDSIKLVQEYASGTLNLRIIFEYFCTAAG